jgi:2-oxoisovalerate dehydrogenase E1 component
VRSESSTAKHKTVFNWAQAARHILASRYMDELEEKELAPKGQIALQFSAKGHELAQVLLAMHLTHPRDAATGYYRSRPFMLAAGLTLPEIFAGNFAKAGSATEGRDTGVLYSMLPRMETADGRKHGIIVLPASGNVGSQYTPATGWAQAIRYHANTLKQKEWKGAIAVAMGGEGSTAANGFWSALNIVATRQLPFIFFIEDNSYAISVPAELQTPGGSISENLKSFKNIEIIKADGTDPLDTYEKIARAVETARAGKPCLLHMKVVRIMGHTFIDDAAYKPEHEKSEDKKFDPLLRLKKFQPNLDWKALEAEVAQQVRSAAETALHYPDPEPESISRHMFSAQVSAAHAPSLVASLSAEGQRVNLIDAVRRTLESEMNLNPHILVFGEDVGVKGGVHGATAHMQKKFGEARVFDTSLSEEGIMGTAQGLSLAGLMPVPEIQFRKYADPATEQINDIGTLRWRTAGKFSAPMVLRIPVGFGKKVGDPYHSVSGEAIFAHTLGWRIAYPSNAADAAGLLRTALRGEDPTLFLEHRALLDMASARAPWPGDEYMLPFGRASIKSEGDALTVVTWGSMVHIVQEAVKDIQGVEILDLRTITPWDKESVFRSVKKTGKCLIVHEDTLTGGFAGEIMACISSELFEHLDAPLQRIAVPDVPIPYNVNLMRAVLPKAADIKSKIEWLINY